MSKEKPELEKSGIMVDCLIKKLRCTKDICLHPMNILKVVVKATAHLSPRSLQVILHPPALKEVLMIKLWR